MRNEQMGVHSVYSRNLSRKTDERIGLVLIATAKSIHRPIGNRTGDVHFIGLRLRRAVGNRRRQALVPLAARTAGIYQVSGYVGCCVPVHSDSLAGKNLAAKLQLSHELLSDFQATIPWVTRRGVNLVRTLLFLRFKIRRCNRGHGAEEHGSSL
jgi:hypothetical protein